MALPCPGPAPISLQNIQTEFGGPSSGIAINSYYRGGSIVSQRWYSDTIPTSGAISFANFFCITKSTFWMVMYYDSSNLPIPIKFVSNGTKLYITTREGVQTSKFNIGLFSLNIPSSGSFPILETLSQLSDNSTASNSLFSSEIGLFTTNGNMYIGGYRRDAPSGSIHEAVLTKYNSNKIIQWQKLISQISQFANPITLISSVSVSNSEEIYASGAFTYNNRDDSAFLNKYNSAGVKLWGRGLYPSLYGDAGSCTTALDSSQNIYLATQWIDYDANFNQTYAPLLVKYNTSGTIIWQKQFSNEYSFITINIDSNDNIYTVSSTISTFNFVGYLRKYNTSGTIIWQKTLPSFNSAQLAFDTSGNIYCCFYKASTKSTVIVKFDATGIVLWQREIGGGFSTSSPSPKDLIVGTNNELYILAQATSGTTNYILVAKIPQDGGPSSTYQYNAPFPQYTSGFNSIFNSTTTVASNSARNLSTNSLPESITPFTSTTRTYPTTFSTWL